MKKLLSVVLCVLLLAASLSVCADENDAGSFGSYLGNTYTNTEAGFAFVLLDGWSFMSEQEIAEAVGLTSEVLNNEAFNAAMEQGLQMNIMTASGADGSSVNINVSPIPAGTYTSFKMLGDRGLLEMIAPSLTEQYASMGFTVSSYEIRTVNFQGFEKDCLQMQVSFLGVELTMLQFYQIREKCMYAVTVATMGAPDSILARMAVTD